PVPLATIDPLCPVVWSLTAICRPLPFGPGALSGMSFIVIVSRSPELKYMSYAGFGAKAFGLLYGDAAIGECPVNVMNEALPNSSPPFELFTQSLLLELKSPSAPRLQITIAAHHLTGSQLAPPTGALPESGAHPGG